ncbi:MAG: hypothetical protein HYX32_12440 [Actinobacteria bacterium]|nr:hypothetical protein [Actinomycetota bacterium]
MLACPFCGAEQPAKTWLWHADQAWTYERRLSGRSPCCGRRYHAELRGQTVLLGTLVGLPGPTFVGASEEEVRGLGVRYLDRAIQLTIGNEHRVVIERQ